MPREYLTSPSAPPGGGVLAFLGSVVLGLLAVIDGILQIATDLLWIFGGTIIVGLIAMVLFNAGTSRRE